MRREQNQQADDDEDLIEDLAPPDIAANLLYRIAVDDGIHQ
jgi:hypothetical protein